MSEEKKVCCNGSTKALILSCSGGSNVGQIANRVMIEADNRGIGNAYCLAGVGADSSGFVENSRAAQTILVDGCPVGCGRKIFEKNKISPYRYFVITEFGIEKRHAFDNLDEETRQATSQIFATI